MRVARYVGAGEVEIREEWAPRCPRGGLLVQTEACGLCSGELMSWYMDSKIPHVLGHEVCGRVIESQADPFPIGSRIFPHHHAPCMKCEFCRSGRHVHCAQWKRTKLDPGGMADFFAVGPENLTDTHLVDDLHPNDAALIEPLACVCKSLALSGPLGNQCRAAVVGLGSMGLLHMVMLSQMKEVVATVGYDLNPDRVKWARSRGLSAEAPGNLTKADVVYICPGSQAAFDFAMEIVEPGGTLVNFAPLGPENRLEIPQQAYFMDLRILNSYSCGPDDVLQAITAVRSGCVRADQICSHFIDLSELPAFYRAMKSGAILKPMVIW